MSPPSKDMNFVKKMCQINLVFSIERFLFILRPLSFFVALLLPVPALADLPPIDELTARIQETYEKTEDMKALFIQDVTIKSLRKTEREEGTFYFKKPRMIRWDYVLPKPKKLIVNENEMWLYVPEDRVAYVQDTKDALDSKTIIRFFSGVGKIGEDFHLQYSDPPVTRSGDYLLILTPNSRQAGVEKLYLTVDRSDLRIKECKFTDLYGNITRLIFKNMRLNSGLPSKLFVFVPPAGVETAKMPRR